MPGIEDIIVRIPPLHYIHVLDNNTNVARVVEGPSTFTRHDHEQIIHREPQKMMTIPPRHFLIVKDPAMRDPETKEVLFDKHKMARLKHGDVEIRTPQEYPDPFPLYPGEELDGGYRKLLVIEKNQALKLKVVRDFTEGEKKWFAGDEFLFKGPGTYTPRVEVEEGAIIKATVVHHSKALLIRAIRDTVDLSGTARSAGEQYLHRQKGAFLPSIDEEIIKTIDAITLTEQKALHLRASKTFTDAYGNNRKAGEEWLVTSEMTESHIPDVYEDVVGTVALTTLTSREYCIVLNPINPVTKEQRLGAKEVRTGECSFFLGPNEELEDDEIKEVYVLADDEALLLQAIESFDDPNAETEEEKHRSPGDRWMVRGPRDFVPDVFTKVLDRRQQIPLDTNEGIYVRNTATGAIRSVIGQSYLLTAREELWEKELSPEAEELLGKQLYGNAYVPPAHHGGGAAEKDAKSKYVRDKTRVVQFRVPNNAAVQVFDFARKTSRVVVGPDMVSLASDEQFTVIRLSGDTPKRPNVIVSLALMMGPDFFTDVVTVETSDHARLRVQLAYNWVFQCDRTNQTELSHCFDVRDFVGDACKALGSRIRGAVASETFDRFHKHSTKIIRASIFGMDEGKVKDSFMFPSNNLVITNVDVQSVEPVDSSTRESLQKSVQLAIEITTKSQEARATYDAQREEAQAQGMLQRQKLDNEAEAENAKKRLLTLQAESKAVETSGQATAEAKARSEAARIENEGLVNSAKLKAEALSIQRKAELQALVDEQTQQLEHSRKVAEIEITKARELAEIEANKFKSLVEAIGSNTIAEIARAGPEMQAKLLSGLGLKTMVLSDGKSPVNLFQAANGLIGMQND